MSDTKRKERLTRRVFQGWATAHAKALVIASAFVLVISAISMDVPSFSAEASKQPLLGERHEKRKVTCQGCHEENPPAKAVATAACLKCHGDPDAVIKKTEKLVPNPHACPHESPADIQCEKCHHAHKSSENYCGQCHAEIILTVP